MSNGTKQRNKDAGSPRARAPTRILTFGHGKAPAGSFDKIMKVLDELQVDRIIDCRAKPVSGRNPKFSREALERTTGDRYEWQGSTLGNPVAFDLPAIPPSAYREAIAELVRRADRGERLVLMCSETDWRKCHRHDWIALDLIAAGAEIEHLEPIDKDWERGSRSTVLSNKTIGRVGAPQGPTISGTEHVKRSPGAPTSVGSTARIEAQQKRRRVADRCVYAEKLLADLLAGERVRQMIWEEKQPWTTAAKWLSESTDDLIPIVFRDADEGGDITHYGILSKVDILDGGRTHYTVERISRLVDPVLFSDLILINAARAIAEGDIRSYRLVKTPEAVRSALEESAVRSSPTR